MLKRIKSIFFSRMIFSYIDENIKLNIIKYNKNLQTLINVNIINYKILSKRIIIKEITKEKEIWKIYNSMNNNLIFEGNDLLDIEFKREMGSQKKKILHKAFIDNGRIIFNTEINNVFGKETFYKNYDKNVYKPINTSYK